MYYYANSQRVAMRTAAGVTYIHSDHPSLWLRAGLGSTSVTSGAQSGDIKYFPYGATRSGAVSTTYKFTGQRLDDSTGLYYYGARYYDAAIGRFVQADSIVPSPGNPQALNRYSYVYNNPLRYTDSTGHDPEDWDPAWVERYKAAHGGSGPTEQDWQDYLLSLQYPGTGPNGAWTEANWLVYYQVTSWLRADLLSQIGQTGGFGVAFYTGLGILGVNLANWNLQPGPGGTWIAVSEMVPPGQAAWTFGNLIIMIPSVKGDIPLLMHEYVHVLQYRFTGIGYGPDYLLWRKDAYEKPAREVRLLYTQHTWLPPIWAFPWAGVHAQHFYWTTAQ